MPNKGDLVKVTIIFQGTVQNARDGEFRVLAANGDDKRFGPDFTEPGITQVTEVTVPAQPPIGSIATLLNGEVASRFIDGWGETGRAARRTWDQISTVGIATIIRYGFEGER